MPTDNDTGLNDLDPATTPARDATHFRQIRAALAGIEQAEAELRDAVAHARAAGDSWTAIGAALETTRQAAYQRFGRDSHATPLNTHLLSGVAFTEPEK